MRGLVRTVMDPRLADLLSLWQRVFDPERGIEFPLERFHRYADHLLVIDADHARSVYTHYGRAFVDHFGVDLTGQIIDSLPSHILSADRRGMLAFEYAYARQVQRPLWRSYTARFDGDRTETWQRLVLPAGGDRLVVGAFPVASSARSDPPREDGEDGKALLRLLIERVPVVVDAGGNILDLALSLETFSDTCQQMEELEVRATRDGLTEAANHLHFRHLASLELDHAYRMGRAMSILVLDIDHFKRINDRWGHPVGDEALKAFASACRRALREQDIFGRIGGEEFAVVLPNSRGDKALMIAERLRKQVEQIALPLECGENLTLTVSIGVVTSPDPTQNADERPDVGKLLAMADVALYRSKADGRNRVTVA
jgi:diguanylate cyclase (GGDEF)-like protein